MSQTTYQLQKIPDGIPGTHATLKIMRRLIKDGRRDPAIRELALKLVADLPQKSYREEARRVHEFVRDRIRYTRDIRGVETVHTPIEVLKSGQGDCDDKTILSCALLESIGHPTRIVAAAYGSPHYSHVFGQTKIGPKWVTLECTENVELGWTAPGMTKFLPYTVR